MKAAQINGTQTGHIPPQALELEQAVLGALMLDRDAINAVGDILTPDAFYRPAHQHIHRAIIALFREGSPVDILTVSEALRKADKLEYIGGSSYLVDLTNRVASAANVEYHALIIKQKHIRRRIIEESTKAIQAAYDDSLDDFDVLEKAEAGLFSISSGIGSATAARPIYDSSAEALRGAIRATEHKGLTGVPSGFTTLDRVTGGWQNTDLIILAARPGMGKTSLAVNMALNAARDFNIPTVVFSLEMSQTQLATRVLSEMASIDSHKMRQGRITEADTKLLQDKVNALERVPLFIDETPGISIFQLRASLRRLKMKHGIGLVVIDYLQLMSGSGDKGKNREQEIAEITRALKAIAKEMKIPVIALSQLSRSVEARGGSKRPQLSDLRESGAIEQDADIVGFIYRPEYYGILEDEAGQSTKGIAEFIFAKHRNGGLGTEKLRFEETFTRFSDLDAPAFSAQFPTAAPTDYTIPANARPGLDSDIPF